MKIKEGDIFVAIFDRVITSTGVTNFKITKGEIFKVCKITHSAYAYILCRVETPDDRLAFSELEVKNYFYNQAEWRDRQIDSIFDED